MAQYVNPFQAGQHRPSTRGVAQPAPSVERSGGPGAGAIPAAAARPPEIPLPRTSRSATPHAVLVAPRRAPMKLMETALISAGAVPGVVPGASEARLRSVLAAPPSSAVLAVAFAALVDDPSAHTDRFGTVDAQRSERERLFGLMARLARPGARRDDALLREARAEIRQACLRPAPPETDDVEQLFHEAQRFQEQDDLGGEDAIDALFTQRRAEYERSGRWRGTLLELRACFWYFWLWEERLGGATSNSDAERESMRALYRQIRAQWDELFEEVERSLEWFRPPRLSGAVRAATG
ncbi:MAG: hypothetical protein SFW08_00560 [Gemmatimonadaceae bacterium]|nr:hypothetical protein [Gemmatimonadaceae bacterium]